MDFFNNGGIDGNYFGFQGMIETINSASSSLLVLDDEKRELVRGLVKPAGGLQKVSSEEKALIALRNHSEAERRRRERINGHLATLRTLIPGTVKMDKAALLAEVINKVKELKQDVSSATNGVLVPTDVDDVNVEEEALCDDDGISFNFRASLCCDFKHQLLSDLKEAVEALSMKMVKAEIATLGSRMVSVFIFARSSEDSNPENGGGKVLADSVRQALRSVLDKFYASEEFTSTTNTLSGKRRRNSFLSPTNSTSMEDIW